MPDLNSSEDSSSKCHRDHSRSMARGQQGSLALAAKPERDRQKNLVLQRPARLQQERLVIFIEAPNLLHGAAELSLDIDFRKLKGYFASGYSLTNAWFYTGIDSSRPDQRMFHTQLRQFGYEVVDKPLELRPDGSTKANFDVEIALDMVKLVNSYDTAVLISGDGDLVRVVLDVQQYRAKVKVVALASMTSSCLRDVANEFIDLAAIQGQIRKGRR
ncbi:NYN domain-containing protein [Leptolyngbya sp. FACHB-541]|uniref:LabA-like NYN domain-containing protein n=1 Tax=Leptolyngbya sp. FACHB-541 TaxID=2692810 RepID=UPI00168A3FC4|nr:NYN domain-containing protein [Leptolyngbya sp. FACHB-541]MBD1999291.1 NYN domain-containing protein [Leptolyngbya sp. FACHB-541]